VAGTSINPSGKCHYKADLKSPEAAEQHDIQCQLTAFPTVGMSTASLRQGLFGLVG